MVPNGQSMLDFTYAIVYAYMRKYAVLTYLCVHARYHLRFFVQVGHETTYAAIGNHHFFTKTCHCQTYQNYKGPL